MSGPFSNAELIELAGTLANAGLASCRQRLIAALRPESQPPSGSGGPIPEFLGDLQALNRNPVHVGGYQALVVYLECACGLIQDETASAAISMAIQRARGHAKPDGPSVPPSLRDRAWRWVSRLDRIPQRNCAQGAWKRCEEDDSPGLVLLSQWDEEEFLDLLAHNFEEGESGLRFLCLRCHGPQPSTWDDLVAGAVAATGAGRSPPRSIASRLSELAHPDGPSALWLELPARVWPEGTVPELLDWAKALAPRCKFRRLVVHLPLLGSTPDITRLGATSDYWKGSNLLYQVLDRVGSPTPEDVRRLLKHKARPSEFPRESETDVLDALSAAFGAQLSYRRTVHTLLHLFDCAPEQAARAAQVGPPLFDRVPLDSI